MESCPLSLMLHTQWDNITVTAEGFGDGWIEIQVLPLPMTSHMA